MEWALVKTFFSLVAVLALMVGVVWFLKKTVYGKVQGGSSLVDIDVLGHRMLQPKRSIFVVKVADKLIVVGVTEAGMHELTEITDAETLRNIDLRKEQQNATSFWHSMKGTAGFQKGKSIQTNIQHSFNTVLLGALGRRKPLEVATDGAEGTR
jgi:flagellar biogenesis protein FliO